MRHLRFELTLAEISQDRNNFSFSAVRLSSGDGSHLGVSLSSVGIKTKLGSTGN